MADSSLSFDQYWSLFVRAHTNPVTRRVHFVATTLGLGCAVASFVTRRRSLLAAGVAVAVVPAWLAHRWVDGGAPSTPRHPVFAVLANLKMWKMSLLGTMDAEVARVLASGAQAVEEDEEPETTPRPNMVTDHTLH